MNSENNGPYGDALTQELIPRVEIPTSEAIGEPWARTLSGGSTGGWESLAWQVFYPDMFNGTWTFCPDPVDFRYFQMVNIYEDANAFYPGDGAKPMEEDPGSSVDARCGRPGLLGPAGCQPSGSGVGPKGRSGDQMDIFMSVYGPVGDDGYPDLLYDKWTGEINPEVAEYWRENYDLRHILERDWDDPGAEAGRKAPHLHGGDGHLLPGRGHPTSWRSFLEGTTDPYYDGFVRVGRDGLPTATREPPSSRARRPTSGCSH